jgi:hypothetical protein
MSASDPTRTSGNASKFPTTESSASDQKVIGREAPALGYNPFKDGDVYGILFSPHHYTYTQYEKFGNIYGPILKRR